MQDSENTRPSRWASLLTVAGLGLAALVALPQAAQAHRDGCHAAHSCPSDTGSYVCGDTGNFSECGYTSIPVYVPPDYDAPRRPRLQAPSAGPKGLVRFLVTAEAGSRLVVRSGGREITSATATGGPQTLTFYAPTGAHRYAVTATDSAGNKSYVASTRVVADATAPSTKQLRVRSGSPIDARSSVSVTPGEFAKYAVLVDGVTVKKGAVEGGELAVLFPLANGAHQVQVRLRDRVGNVAVANRRLRVAVAKLKPIVELLSEPNNSTQSFTVSGSPGSRGALKVGDQVKRFVLGDAATSIDLDLPDGNYSGATVALSDRFGRRGMAALPRFVVDTAFPDVVVTRGDGKNTTGRLVAVIVAAAGSEVAWRIVNGNGEEVKSAVYTSTGASRSIDEDVEEGSYTLEVAATDAAGNTNEDDLSAVVEADPLTPAEIAIAFIMLVLLILLLVLAWWNRKRIAAWRAKRMHDAAVKAAQRAHNGALAAHAKQITQHRAAVAAYEVDLSRWTERKVRLTQLLDEARTLDGVAGAASTITGVKLKPGERVYPTVGAVLVEKRTRQNAPDLADVENGRVTVTSTRVLFQGDAKKREWAFDKLAGQPQHHGENVTLLPVNNRKTLSGVRYTEAERTRLHLDVALADLSGSRERVVDAIGQRLHAHEVNHPSQPAGPPSAPEPPELLRPAPQIQGQPVGK